MIKFVKKNQKPMIDYFIRGRHSNCSVIYLRVTIKHQRIYVSINCSHFGIYDFPSNDEKSMICRENCIQRTI